MAQRERFADAAKRPAAVLMLLTLLGTAGCMMRREALTSTTGDVVSTIDPPEQALDRCEDFACEQ
jgi:hypothetical protein